MEDRTNHNRFAEQMAARLRDEAAAIEHGIANIAAFEKKARGETPRKRKRSEPKPSIITAGSETTAATAAEVASPRSTPTMSNVYNLFQPAESTTAHLKAGFMGKQGAGKSVTGSLLAIGLVRQLQAKGVNYASKPVA